MERDLLAALALLVGGYSSFGAPTVIDTAVHPVTGHIHYLLETSNWTEAENAAVGLGGHLATINDAAENNWISTLWGNNRTLWIGFTDAAAEGDFVWTSGEPVTYTNWRVATQEPNDGVGWGNPTEEFTYIYANGVSESQGEWNDYLDVTGVAPQPPLHGVAEVNPVPEPGVVTLLLLCGGLGWAARLSAANGSDFSKRRSVHFPDLALANIWTS